MRIIAQTLESLGIPYDFEIWTGEVDGPYWVGHYIETEPVNEDGMTEASFIITGTTRGQWLELEQTKAKIMGAFDPVDGYSAITESGTGVAIWYASATTVPTGVAGLKRLEITLKTKEWRA